MPQGRNIEILAFWGIPQKLFLIKMLLDCYILTVSELIPCYILLLYIDNISMTAAIIYIPKIKKNLKKFQNGNIHNDSYIAIPKDSQCHFS